MVFVRVMNVIHSKLGTGTLNTTCQHFECLFAFLSGEQIIVFSLYLVVLILGFDGQCSSLLGGLLDCYSVLDE